jgi:hypothetical protein
LVGFATCFLFLPLGSPCFPLVSDCFGGTIGYLFRNFVIIHTNITLPDSSILLQRPTFGISGDAKHRLLQAVVRIISLSALRGLP